MNREPAQYLIYTRDDAGYLTFGAVHDPYETQDLELSLGASLTVVGITPTKHAEKIAAEIHRRFRAFAADPRYVIAGVPVTYVASIQAITDAINEYDPLTGERVRARGLVVGTPVHVVGAGDGTVRGFTLCGRVKVAIERYAHAALEVLAPASLVEVRA